MTLARVKGPMLNHAMLRAEQRYGLILTIDDLKAITRAIQRNKGTLLARLKDGKSAWSLPWQGRVLKLVMSPDLWKVITLLPPDAVIDPDHKPKLKKRRKQKAFWRGGKRYFARKAA